MEVGKSFAIKILSNAGFQVKDIPVSVQRTADLLVTDNEANYLIEVKEKVESVEQAEERRAILNSGELYEQSDLLARDNTISGILRSAQKQLDASEKAEGTYQLIWFHATGVDADLKYRQAFSTFYGHVDLIPMNPRSSDNPPCFYFDYCAAVQMPTVDALILTDNTQLQLCLNEFSDRAKEFQETPFCRKFAEMDGVIDPVSMASKGSIIACRAMIPRKNDDEIAKALQEQTGVLYSPIRLTRHACSAAVVPPERKSKS